MPQNPQVSSTGSTEPAPIEVSAFELRRVSLPLVTPFRASYGVETERDVLLVRVMSDGADGWGECVAMSAPLYTEEYVDGAELVIRQHLVPRLFAADVVSAATVSDLLGAVRGHPMAKAALEAAVLDAELRAAGVSMASYFGATRTAVDAGVAVGITDSVEELIDVVEGLVDQGYRRVKLKIEPGWDVEPVRAVRERFGDDLLLQVDANAAYTVDDTEHLAGLDPFGLLLIEQPLPEDDLAGHAAVASTLTTPVCLDESIRSARDADRAISMGACSIVNVKPGRVGGLREARRIHDLCANRGVPVWCGGMLETGIGRAANVALAALANFTLPGDLSASDRYFHRDITPPFVLDDGRLKVPSGPGIGVEPDPDLLDEFTTSTTLLEP